MYKLGDQFEPNLFLSKSKDNSIVKGNTYRFTVLTERLIRLEYNPKGIFFDNPTQLVVNRNFEVPKFIVKEDSRFLEISTNYFMLQYLKDRPFDGGKITPMNNLKVTLLNATDKVWYYHHPEVRNFNGTAVSLDVVEGKVLYQKGLYSQDGFASIDDSNGLLMMEDGTFLEREKGSIDIYLFMYHEDFKLALKDYFELTGKPSLIPRYALGNWWSKNATYTDRDVKEVVAHFEQNRIPISVFLLDKDWHIRNMNKEKNLFTGYTFNQELFPNPLETISWLHHKNIRVGLQVNPKQGLYPFDLYYPKACEYLGVTDNKIIAIDPMNPKFMDVYLKLYLHPLEQMGIDFFWNDYDDFKKIPYLWLLNHYHYYDSGRNVAKRNMLLARNGMVAAHRYPVLYSGKTIVSWETLKTISYYNLTSSNIGISWWSHDIGGNHGGIEESELYIRYVELGVFSPIFRFHSARGRYYKREPWRWDVKTLSVVDDYLRLRHRLVPYLYTEAYNYHKDGTFLVEPFYYKYPWIYDDVVYHNQYFFGSQLMVAPILDRKDLIMNRTIHKFFIPEGVWYDFKTGKKFPGNKKYVSFYKDEDYPVFASSGAIIPLSNNNIINSTALPSELEIHIFPGKNNTYYLYEDDGITSLYKEGYFLKTSIDYNYLANNYTVVIRAIEGKSGIVPEKRDYKIRFRNTKQADEVIVYFNDALQSTNSYVSGNDFVVELKGIPTVGQLTINCKGRDIEIDAIRVINEDIDSILSDLQINTTLKEKISDIIFSDMEIKRKRIAIRKLKSQGLQKDTRKLFLKLLEYIGQI